MKRLLSVIALLAAAASWTHSATAGVVVVGSTYGVYLEGSQSGDTFFAQPQFDNVAEAGPRGNQNVTISESQTSLTATGSRIDVFITAPNDLFPVLNETASIGIGVLDPFDLAYAVSLDDVRVTLRNLANEIIFTSENIASLAEQGSPWDGTFLALLETLDITEIGGMGVTSIEFNFYVNQLDAAAVPEPGSVLLFGLALLALSVFQKRRQR